MQSTRISHLLLLSSPPLPLDKIPLLLGNKWRDLLVFLKAEPRFRKINTLSKHEFAVSIAAIAFQGQS